MALAVGFALGGDVDAGGPPPPHQPGTVCFTKYFWCWAQPPGPTGTKCGCVGPQGWVAGIRG